MKKMNKPLIRLLAFITVSLFLIVYLGIVSYADEGVKPVEKFSIDACLTTDDFPELSYASSFLYQPNNSSVTTYNNLISSNPNLVDGNILGGLTLSQWDYYCWTNDAFFVGDNLSFLCVGRAGGNNFYLHIPGDMVNYLSQSNQNYISRGYITSGLAFTNTDIQHITYNNLITIDGESYVRLGYYEQKLINSNMKILYTSGDSSNINSLDGLQNINPNFTPSNEEDSSNNLYLKYGQFDWTIYKPINDNIIGDNFNTSNLEKSRLNFNYEFNDYQQNHLNEFSFELKVDILYSMKFTGQSEFKNFSGSYTYNIPFSNSNGSSLSYPFSGIFNDTGFSTYFNNNYAGDIDFQNSKFIIYASIKVVDNNGNGGNSTSDQYNVLTNTVRTTSSNVTTNNNPFVPTSSDVPIVPEGDSPENLSGSNNNGIITGGNGNGSGIYIDNRFTNSNNNDVAGATVDYVKDTLYNTAGEGDSYDEQLSSMTHSNGFIDYMKSCFSFIPIWDDLADYFKIFLGILVAYFVLRLLLDIL